MSEQIWVVEISQEQEGVAPILESQIKLGSLSSVVSKLMVSGEQRCQIKNTGRTTWTDIKGRTITIAVTPSGGA